MGRFVRFVWNLFEVLPWRFLLLFVGVVCVVMAEVVGYLACSADNVGRLLKVFEEKAGCECPDVGGVWVRS